MAHKIFLTDGRPAVLRDGRVYVLPVANSDPQLLLTDIGPGQGNSFEGRPIWHIDDHFPCDTPRERRDPCEA